MYVCLFFVLQTLRCICRIAENLIALQQAGNIKYTGWVLQLQCKVNMVPDLQSLAKEMELELCEWIDSVKRARDEFYELNYFTTKQLLILRKELGRFKRNPDPDVCHQRPTTVLALLHSISPAIDELPEVIQEVVCESLHELSNSAIPCDSMSGLGQPSHTSDICSQSLAADILASVDTGVSIPQPSVSAECLSIKQKDLLVEMTNYGFTEDLVMMAFEECGENEHKIWDWCEENELSNVSKENLPSEPEDEVETDTDTSSESSNPEAFTLTCGKNVDLMATVEYVIVIFTIHIGKTSPSKSDALERADSRIVYIERQTIDGFHPVVQQLSTSLGYSLNDSMEAVEYCGHQCTVEKAMDYLMARDDHDEDTVFHSSAVAYSDSDHEGSEDEVALPFSEWYNIESG